MTYCDKKDKIPKNEWAMNKGLNMFNESKNESKTEETNNTSSNNDDEDKDKGSKWNGS